MLKRCTLLALHGGNANGSIGEHKALAQDFVWIQTTDGAEAQKSVLVDVGDDNTDLVHVCRQQQRSGFPREAGRR